MSNITRRRWLHSGLATAGATLLANSLPAGEKKKPHRIGLGFSLYGMRSLSIDDALLACKRIGYDCIELPVMAGWPGDTSRLSADRGKQIREKMQATGLRLAGIMENLHAAVDDSRHKSNLARIEAAGKLGRVLSPERTPVVETILGGRPAQWEAIKKQMATRLRDWATAAEKVGAIIAIKAHVGGAMHRPEHPVWLALQIDSPWIRCAYDYSHFELRNIDMAESVRTLVPHSDFIHVKDSQGDASKVRFLLPGQGKIDYVALLKLIVAAGYQRDIVVEVSGQIHGKPGYKPLDAARSSYEHMAAAFAKAGIERG